jgi:hypothetical protein
MDHKNKRYAEDQLEQFFVDGQFIEVDASPPTPELTIDVPITCDIGLELALDIF